MIIKKYVVNSMNEALTRIRYELGPEAVIISQRKIKKPGFIGFFSHKVIEVTAAVDKEKKDQNVAVRNSIEAIKKVMEKNNLKSVKNKSVTPPDTSSEKQLLKEMQEMKSLLFEMKSGYSKEDEPKSELQIKLENVDINPDIIEEILKHATEENLRETLENMVPVSEVNLKGTIVLVGPTGIGKTTTIAKLAGKLALIEKKKVGLITIDTYRIGAVEQLRTYADIMNIPFKVVLTTKEMELAIESMKDCDAILVDTTGRSSKNAMQISELRAFIQKANTDNIHLVISCTTKNNDINTIIEGYKSLNYNHIIITKLDETTTYGSILNIVKAAKKPISFLTTGQNVPDDLKVPKTSEIVSLLLGEEKIC